VASVLTLLALATMLLKVMVERKAKQQIAEARALEGPSGPKRNGVE
jgi:ABC-type sulfate transport system permease subunit